MAHVTDDLGPVPPASLEDTPAGEGWYVLNATEAEWEAIEGMGRYCRFEGPARFEDFGFNIHVVEPGEPNAMYHGEEGQESFLVLSGECLLIIEGEERRLKQWDMVHCPSGTDHVFVGAGSGPCAIMMAGVRGKQGLVYPADPVARSHGAGVEETTGDGKQAYADYPDPVAERYRPGTLPGA